MSFTDDQSLLNGINIDSIIEYQKFIDQMKPLLLDQSGYQEVDASKKMGWQDTTDAADSIYNRSGLAAGASETDAAAKLGLSLKDFRSAKALVDESNGYYSKGVNKNPGRSNEISNQLRAFQTTDTTLQKTPDRIALEKRFSNLQDSELKQLEDQVNYYNSDAGKALLDQQRKNVSTQSALSAAQLQRQQDALDGKIGVSDVLSKQIADQFNTFKEAQARNGNVIMGDTLDTAVAKGSAAQEALRAFQDNAKAAAQREKEAIIQGEGSTTQTGLNLSSGLTAGTLQFGGPGPFTANSSAYNNAMPGNPGYSGLSAMTLQGQQPYQFDQNLQFNYDQLAASRKKGSSGMSGLIGSLAGAGIGGLLAAPTGGMSIPMGMMLGSQFGGSAGMMFH